MDNLDNPRPPETSLAFGPYEANLRSAELRKKGVRIKIQDLPFRVLQVLARRAGEVVTRQELQKHLWPDDTFVAFEDGLNTAVSKLREALCDDAGKPRYIETIPRRGYRFLAKVEYRNGGDSRSTEIPTTTEIPANGHRQTLPLPNAAPDAAVPLRPELSASGKSVARPLLAVTAVVVSLLAVAAIWLFYSRSALSFNARDSVLVADFDNQTGEPRLDQALRAAFIVSIEQSRHVNVFPRARVESVLQMMGKSATERVTSSLGLEVCQREGVRGLIVAGITRTGNDYVLTGELIDPQTGATVRSYSQHSNGEDHILAALDVIAADIRHDLGESLYQIKRANSLLPQVTTSSMTALKQYAEASDLWHRGRYQDGLTLFRAAIQSDPDFAMAHAALGSAYFSYIYHMEPQGKEEYEKALSLSPRMTERERMIIQTMYASDEGHVGDAETLYRSYLGRYPDDWRMLSDYAHLLRTHGRQKEALEQYKQVLKLAPDDAKTYIEMATAHKTLNDYPEALSAYGEAFRIDPRLIATGDIGREYGAVLLQSGQEQKARQIFTDTLEKPETRERGMRSLALLDLYHGHYAEAEKRLEECLVILRGQQAAALSEARVHLWLSYIAEGRGDVRTEVRQLDAATQLLKDIGPKVVFGAWIGQAYARAGLVDRAEKIEALIAPLVDGKNAEQMSYQHLLQGEIALARKDQEKGIELLALSSKENPTGFSEEAVAHAYQQAGRTTDAIPAFEQFLAHQNKSMLWEPQQRWIEAHYTLAGDYLAQGDQEKAKNSIVPFLDLWQGADSDLPLLEKARAELAQLNNTNSAKPSAPHTNP
jgi:eukaryotic-like serine/threonine-protein kinase